jgi:hypothetical protein
MRSTKRNRPPQAAIGRPLNRNNHASRDEAISSDDVRHGVDNVKISEQVLIDRFGHQHSHAVLALWPDRVREAMGLRFVEKSELRATNAR